MSGRPELAAVAIAPVTEAVMGGALQLGQAMAEAGVKSVVIMPDPELSHADRAARLFGLGATQLTIVAPHDGTAVEQGLAERDESIAVDFRNAATGLFAGRTLLATASRTHGERYDRGEWVLDATVTIGGIDAGDVLTDLHRPPEHATNN